MPKKVLYAIGNQLAEETITEKVIKGKYEICKPVFDSSQIEKAVEDYRPDIILLSDGLNGFTAKEDPEHSRLLHLLFQIRANYSAIQIIFITTKEDKELFSNLVYYQVYDILIGKLMKLSELKNALNNPKTFQDVAKFQKGDFRFQNSEELQKLSNIGVNAEAEKEEKKKGGLFGRKKKEKEDEDEYYYEEPEIEAPKAEKQKKKEEIKKEEAQLIAKPEIKEEEPPKKEELSKPISEVPTKDYSGYSEDEKERELEKAEVKKELLKEEVKDIEDKIRETEQDCAKLENDKAILYRQWTTGQDKIPLLEKEIEDLKRKITEKGSVEDDPEVLAKLEDEKAQLEKELSEIYSQSDFLNKACTMLYAKKRLYDFLQDEISEDDIESTEVLEKFLEVWKEETKVSTTDLKKLKEELEKIATESKALEEESVKWQQAKIAGDFNLGKLKEEIKANEKEAKEHEEKLTPLKEKLEKLKEKNDTTAKEVEEINQKINEESKRNLTVEGNLKALRNLKALSADDSSLALEQLQSENERLKEQLKNFEGYKKDSMDLMSKNQKIQELIEENKKLKERGEIATPDVNIFTSVGATFDSEKELLKLENRHLLEENEELKDDIDDLKEKLEEKDGKISNLEMKAANLAATGNIEGEKESTLSVDSSVTVISKVPNPIGTRRTRIAAGNKSKYSPPHSDTRKIIAFVGTKSGVGNSTLAINTAALLAKTNKVLYIETNDVNPAVLTWLDIPNDYAGLEDAFAKFSRNDYNGAKKSIVKPNISSIPKSLNFLSYSAMYTINPASFITSDSETKAKAENLDAFIKQIKMDGEYDYIILDISPFGYAFDGFKKGQLFVDQVFFTTSQDIHAYMNCGNTINEMMKKSRGLIDSAIILLNKFDPDSAVLENSIRNVTGVKNRIFNVMLNNAALTDCIMQAQVYSLIGPSGAEPFIQIAEKC